MQAPRTLRRLLRVLELEEEQALGALEAALGELRELAAARVSARARVRRGQDQVAASALSGDLVDRLAGMAEMQTARRLSAVLKGRITAAEEEAAAQRETFLAKRVERRQAETLVREAEARKDRETERRSRQSLDEWFLNREHREGRAVSQKTGWSVATPARNERKP